MNYVINSFYDAEDIIIKNIDNYLREEVKISKIFPHFGNVRVSGIHPFVFLMDKNINGTQEPNGLFPSVTIVDDSSMKEQSASTPTLEEVFSLDNKALQQIIDNRDVFFISDEILKAIQTSLETKEFIMGRRAIQRRKSNYVIEVWADNREVKNKIYDVIITHLVMNARFTLKRNYDIIIDEESISGERGGNYNYDFGKILHGGIIRFSVTSKFNQYFLDEEAIIIKSVDVVVNEIKIGG